ncbi:MAG: NfeD family protein, partial [Coriobacteriia bacterium]|nr:NfeD family protein [Coriobacteriia bacterium]
AGLAFADVPLIWQWVVFIGASAVLLLGLRRFADRVTHEPPEKFGADRLIGKQGIVIETLDPGDGNGRVRIEREEWRADTSSPDAVPEGSQVIVERVSGTHLVVRTVDEPSEVKE